MNAWNDLGGAARVARTSARRLFALAALCAASTLCLATGVAWADPGPSNVDPPTISGVAQEGNVLTADPGTWSSDTPIDHFTYDWSDGQTGSTATLSAADVGQTLTVLVTAVNGTGQASATSAGVGPVLPAAPVNSNPPVITGTAQQGDTLSVSNGSWTGSPTAFSYAWEDCDGTGNSCAPIPGATSNSYQLQPSDVGNTIVASVTASNLGGPGQSSSSPTASVLPSPPQIGTAPGISGIAQQGQTLSASTGVWDNNPTSFAYAWQDCGSTGSPCSPIAGATSSTYVVQASNVNHLVSVKVTASNLGGHTPVNSASVGPVLPPPPANTQAPTITGTPEQGDTLSVSTGAWSNATTFSYAWAACNGSGTGCSAIPGATSSSYALSGADVGSTIVCVVTATGPGGSASVRTDHTAVVIPSPIPASSQPTTTALLATPSAAVTNQSVTLVATVTAGSSSTALWGTVTFSYGGAAVGGCTGMPVVPSGPSATVACVTSFAASTAQLSATFTPTVGSILKGSASPAGAFTVMADSSTTSLGAPSSVTVRASTTYTATVTPPAARPGPIAPTGSVEFLDGGQPIGSCTSQPLSGGAATCTVSYAVAAVHQISARYAGDANFTASASSTDPVNAVSNPPAVLGRIASTMQWAFYYTPRYTVVRHLVVNGAAAGATVLVRCHGHGCPFARHATLVGKGKRCSRKKAGKACLASGTLDIAPGFGGRHLAVGARITVSIIRPNWIGKSYMFTVRARRGPRIQIGCLTPGGTSAGVGC